MKRALSPSLNPTGIGSAVAAFYAAVVMIVNAVNHHGVIDMQVIVAALSAAAFLYARFKVTPVADPKDGNGTPLKAAGTLTFNMPTAPPAEIGKQVAAAITGNLASGGTLRAQDAPSEPPAGPAA